MPFYQRAFLYLFRKRTKTALLFLILLLVNSMILGTVMILHAAQTTQISIEKKSKAKAVCEITQDRDRILPVILLIETGLDQGPLDGEGRLGLEGLPAQTFDTVVHPEIVRSHGRDGIMYA